LLKATISFVMPVRLSACNYAAPTERIFKKFYIWVFFWQSVEKMQVPLNLTTIMGTFKKTNTYFFILSSSFLLRTKNVSDKSCKKTRNTHFMINNLRVFSKICILWHNVETYLERGRPQMTIWRTHIVWWMPMATIKLTGCVILIAFPLQKWLHKRASLLCYTYIACLNFLRPCGSFTCHQV
jgi:hypothetical protein